MKAHGTPEASGPKQHQTCLYLAADCQLTLFFAPPPPAGVSKAKIGEDVGRPFSGLRKPANRNDRVAFHNIALFDK